MPNPQPGDAILLVGTAKGAFILASNAERVEWSIAGPHFPGESVYALAYDQRGGRGAGGAVRVARRRRELGA